tara:strand:+ start:4329 stop:5984 length:1656 start_codon:yes stop_codon:yes gene_type:complete
MKLLNVLIVVFSLTIFSLSGQQLFLPLDHDENAFSEMYLSKKNVNFHTSIKPYFYEEVDAIVKLDSIDSQLVDTNRLLLLPTSNWAKALRWTERKLLDEDLVFIKKPGFKFRANLLLDLNLGRDQIADDLFWQNTRGYWLAGKIGGKVYFESTFYENQAKLLPYVTEYVNAINTVVPGAGRSKPFKEGVGTDWAFATGAVGYKPSKYFTLAVGHGKHFLGEGYRSLLLSDNAFNYPYIKLETNVWNIKYVNMWAQLSHIGFSQADRGDGNLTQKYLAVHYLSWNATKRFNISLYESISWLKADKGFDWQYMNPIIFLRPVEWQNGSADNVLLGLSTKYKLSDKVSLYGQFVLDDFNVQEFKEQNGYWGNKYGAQIGLKAFNLFKVYGLSAQAEYNIARPFTYTHFDSTNGHGHMNQPLAHPLGANFQEAIGIVRYKYKRHKFSLKILWSEFGTDSSGVNHGGDVFVDYNTNRVDINGDSGLNGYKIGQGITNKLNYFEARYAYLVNPRAKLFLEIGFRERSLSKQNLTDSDTRYYFIGLRTSLNNFYNDYF